MISILVGLFVCPFDVDQDGRRHSIQLVVNDRKHLDGPHTHARTHTIIHSITHSDQLLHNVSNKLKPTPLSNEFSNSWASLPNWPPLSPGILSKNSKPKSLFVLLLEPTPLLPLAACCWELLNTCWGCCGCWGVCCCCCCCCGFIGCCCCCMFCWPIPAWDWLNCCCWLNCWDWLPNCCCPPLLKCWACWANCCCCCWLGLNCCWANCCCWAWLNCCCCGIRMCCCMPCCICMLLAIIFCCIMALPMFCECIICCCCCCCIVIVTYNQPNC